MRLVGTATVLLIAGCSIDTRVRAGDPAPDAAMRRDAHVMAVDAGAENLDGDREEVDGGEPRVDGGTDGGRAVADSGERDAGRPDGGRPPCDDLYAGSSSYSLCDQRATECEFYEVLGGTTCADRCARGGGVCVTSWTEAGDPPDECVRADDLGCDFAHNDGICICSR